MIISNAEYDIINEIYERELKRKYRGELRPAWIHISGMISPEELVSKKIRVLLIGNPDNDTPFKKIEFEHTVLELIPKYEMPNFKQPLPTLVLRNK